MATATNDMNMNATSNISASNEVDDVQGNGLEITSDTNLDSETFNNFEGDGIAVLEGVNVELDEVESTSNGDDGFEIRGNVTEASLTANESSFNLNGDDGIDVFGENSTVNLFRVEASFNEGGGLGVDGLNNTFNIDTSEFEA
ncbi:MAG: hypothetical protein SWZ49_01495, partial [Cyanobacteriota bacterium]|nr:hypothetical protein [Cyanobacteriota bacterium]